MTMLSQPPPDASAPPPSEEALQSQRKMSWLWLVGMGSILGLFLLGFLSPLVIRSGRIVDETQAVNNARMLGIVLIEFQNDYGKFPDTSTIAAVRLKTGTTLNLGTVSSNDFFRQLLAYESECHESMFYAKTAYTHRPDGIITGTSALEKGECGFTYFLGATETDNPNRPLLVTPMIPKTDRFDSKALERGKAVILHMDNSFTRLNIDKDGHAILDGRNLMDPHHPIWDSHAPTIAWPE